MIFYLHYILLTSGLSGVSVLLGVFLKAYSDASQGEIGFLLMTFPFVSIIIKPLFCSMADRHQAHRSYLIMSLVVLMIGYAPFAILPFFPEFYTRFPRATWYLLVVSCHIGNGGLGVAWSLGESLAVNMAQRTGTPYSRMRLMGTVSWGIYGYIIGQLNETPSLPKYVPSFLVLHLSVLIEIILLSLWNKDDFVMYDPNEDDAKIEIDSQGVEAKAMIDEHPFNSRTVDSTPSSLGGTLRLSSKAAEAVRDIFASEDISKRLQAYESGNKLGTHGHDFERKTDLSIDRKDQLSLEPESQWKSKVTPKNDCERGKKPGSNLQIIILRLIFTKDGRMIKYLVLYTIAGLLLSPMSFLFLSLVDVCEGKGYNFSLLAGSVLVSQATIETIIFLLIPWMMIYISRSVALGMGLLVLAIKYFFYASYFYTSDISPYWALVGEWGHGIAYGIYCTLMADVALMFANQSKLFIPELREMGLLSQIEKGNEAKVLAEENAIRMALRATMQAIFGGFMDGLGSGLGNVFCGIIVEAFSYTCLWQIYFAITVVTLLVYQSIEATEFRWSDSFRVRNESKVSGMENQLKKAPSPAKSSEDGGKNATQIDCWNRIENNVKH